MMQQLRKMADTLHAAVSECQASPAPGLTSMCLPSSAKLSWKAACRAASPFGSRLPKTVRGLTSVEGMWTCSESPGSMARCGVPTGVGQNDCVLHNPHHAVSITVLGNRGAPRAH